MYFTKGSRSIPYVFVFAVGMLLLFFSIICRNKKETMPQKVYILDICGEDAIYFKKSIEEGKITKVIRSNKKSLSLYNKYYYYYKMTNNHQLLLYH